RRAGVFVCDAELDLLRASIHADEDGRWPGAHPELLRDLLLRILHERERQSQALANFLECIAVVATVERHDEGRFSPTLMQSLQPGQLGETRRRPGLPEIQQDLTADETMQHKLLASIGFERNIGRRVAARKLESQRTKSRR